MLVISVIFWKIARIVYALYCPSLDREMSYGSLSLQTARITVMMHLNQNQEDLHIMCPNNKHKVIVYKLVWLYFSQMEKIYKYFMINHYLNRSSLIELRIKVTQDL